ncbi:MAG: enoyl-CoA hydratase/isomerase family protein [Alphaproteobacteria bacterium]|nr:enoyl-CoA hydratase/isomerase family protein [Alphaproteobacteria bacterium]MCW5739744.1 enoyl-CoA hydratase/isomerase family protein [Alphaproteobacteria bacterium]
MLAFPDYRCLLATCDGDVARLTFNRPERRNALTHEMMQELSDAFARIAAEVERDPIGLRALVLRGAGGFFCAGGDIGFMKELPPAPADGRRDPLVAPYRAFGDTLLELNRLPLAVIAIVDGPAAGGGFGMACASDVVIMHESARFGIPEPRAGFIPSQVLPLIARRIGEGATRELALTTRMMDAREALEVGVGRHLCADEAAIQAVLARTLDDIRRGEPGAVATVKRLVLMCATESDAAVLDAAALDLIRLLRGAPARAGMKAFLEKQRPPWVPRDGR